MIHLVLRSPNGDGTYSDALGMTTDNVPHTVNGVVCLPGIIGDDSVSQMESAIDISQAMGNVSQGVSWSFDTLDWTGSARRSVGILDGGTRFVGWRVAMYLSDTGAETTLAPVCGSADAFQVSDVEPSGTRVTLSVVSAWTLQAGALGFAYGEQVVGLVAGDHAVSVQTIAAKEQVTISRVVGSPYHFGNPEASSIAATTAETSTADAPIYWDGIPIYYAKFPCATAYDASYFLSQIDSTTTICSSDASLQIIGHLNIGADAYVGVSPSKYSQIFTKEVRLVKSLRTIPVCFGVGAFIGFGEIDKPATPDATIDIAGESGLLTITSAPTTRTPGDLRCYTTLYPKIGWELGDTGADVTYTGATQEISTNPNNQPEFSGVSATGAPTGPVKFAVTKEVNTTTSGQLDCRIRLVISRDDYSGYDRFVVGYRARIDTTVQVDTLHFPFDSANHPVSAGTMTREVMDPSSIDANFPGQKFATLDDANASSGISLIDYVTPSPGVSQYICVQIQNISLYGVSQQSLGDVYANVKPGASPWWSAPLQPAATAAALLNAVAPASTPNIPKGFDGYPFGLSGWGQYFEPEKTHTEAAVALCEEFWSILCPDGVDGQSGAGLGEVIGTPPSALGAVEDVVTEPTIEYAPVGGNYTGKAYIAHVDEEFDTSNAARFYGGWGKGADDSEFPGGDYGYMIWRTCREAYKVHGIRRAATYQFDGVHFAGNVGGYWFEAMRNGARRIEWLAYQPRFVTFKIREDGPPTWWAGNSVMIPTAMAGFAGYDLSAFSTDPVISVSKTFDPVTMKSEYEVVLPPVISTGSTDRIIQTANVSNDRIVQSLTATDRIIQVIEA